MDKAGRGQARGTTHGRERTGIALILAAVLCFSVIDATSKTLARDYPVLQVAWARYFFHFIVFTPPTLWRFRSGLYLTKRPALHVVRALLLVGVTALLIGGLAYLPLADATALTFVTPLIVVVLSALVMGEKIEAHQRAAVGIGFLGVLIIVRPGGELMHWASFLVLGMAFCFAGYHLTTRVLNRTEMPVTTLFYTATVGTIVSSVWLPFVWQWPTPTGWALMLLLGTLGGGGHYLLIVAFRYASPAIAAPFMYAQLVFATALGWAIFDYVPTAWTILGAALIVAGGLWSWWHERRIRANESTLPVASDA